MIIYRITIEEFVPTPEKSEPDRDDRYRDSDWTLLYQQRTNKDIDLKKSIDSFNDAQEQELPPTEIHTPTPPKDEPQDLAA